MAKLSFTTFTLYVVSLCAVATAKRVFYPHEPACVTETFVSPLFGIGPTRTVYVSTKTTTSSLDCHGCSLILKTAFPVPDIVSFPSMSSR